jgi:hypothetical protein
MWKPRWDQYSWWIPVQTKPHMKGHLLSHLSRNSKTMNSQGSITVTISSLSRSLSLSLALFLYENSLSNHSKKQHYIQIKWFLLIRTRQIVGAFVSCCCTCLFVLCFWVQISCDGKTFLKNLIKRDISARPEQPTFSVVKFDDFYFYSRLRLD